MSTSSKAVANSGPDRAVYCSRYIYMREEKGYSWFLRYNKREVDGIKRGGGGAIRSI